MLFRALTLIEDLTQPLNERLTAALDGRAATK